MFGWRPKASLSRLAALLADYPPFSPVHSGYTICNADSLATVLTLEQCRENFVAYRDSVSERLHVLGPVLAALNIEIDDAYDDTLRFVRALHPTLLRELPSLYRPAIADRTARELSDRAGDAIVLSFLADLAMLETDVLIRAKPGAFLGMNLDRRDRLMLSYRRPCLLGLGDSLYPDSPPSIYHVEAEWFGYYANMDRPTRLAPPDFAPGMYMDVIGGPLLQRLERDIPYPDLARLKQTTWMRDAA